MTSDDEAHFSEFGVPERTMMKSNEWVELFMHEDDDEETCEYIIHEFRKMSEYEKEIAISYMIGQVAGGRQYIMNLRRDEED